ncbi:PepSY domain-containing protein [Salinicoccus carnicancri]|uniref:PepSY domain-containing protein n=1 Tax=Salinicoccus carnicancri TaxID=558170 RepID=UPI0002FB09B9|nr:PepSY domain-containing protein [Salinicoccus carnicancri]
MSHRFKLAGILLSAGLIMAACGGDGEDPGGNGDAEDTSADEGMQNMEEDNEDAGGGNDTSDDQPDSSGSSSSETISQEDINHEAREAVDAAMENYDGRLTQIELDHEEGQWVYKLDMEQNSEEYETSLSVDDLSVINEQAETDDDKDSEDQFEYGDAMTAEEAVQTAIDEAGGSGDIEGWSLDRDDGALEYEIELKNTDDGDADITIDAESGEVTSTDYDNGDDDSD